MRSCFRIFVGVFLFLVFGDSIPLRGQNPSVPPSPDFVCEPMKGYDPGMCLTAGDGDPQGPLADRIPVILIHGWNPKEIAGEPDLLVWEGLGGHLWDNRRFRERFKMYFLVYLSNIQGHTIRDMGLNFRSLIGRMDQTDPDFMRKPLAIIGYSMGGLIARSFMKERQPDSARFGGDRVLRLITLGTPHHGSPFANGPARDVKAGLEVFLLHQFVDGGLFGYNIRWDMDNRYDLHWDNYDDMLNYKSFPENSLWMEWLNSGETFEDKIVAYGGKATRLGQIGDCILGAEGSACLAAVMNRTLGISESDGTVPLKSALFDPCKNCIATRIFDDYDHSEIARGKLRFPWESEPLFEDIASNLLSIVVSVPVPTPTPPPPPPPSPAPTKCAETPISFGQLVRDNLTDSDCTLPLQCYLRGGSLSAGPKAKRYTFRGNAGQEAVIFMVASAFIPGGLPSPAVRLLRSDGSLLAGNGGGPSDTTPTVRIRLPSSGTYAIEVTSGQCDARGNYNLGLD